MFSFLKGNVFVMIITRCLGFFSRGAAFPYASLYVLALGGDTESVGFINSLRPLASLLIFPIAGYLTDRRGRVKLIVAATYLSAMTYCFYILADGWLTLAVGNFINGLIVFHFPAQSALIADSLPPKQRGIGFATYNAVPGAVAIAAPFLAGHLIEKVGVDLAMRLLYALLLVSYAASATIQMRYLRETIHGDESSFRRESLRTTITKGYSSAINTLKWMPSSLKALAIIIALVFTANAISGGFWVVYGTRVIGLSASEWGLLTLIYSALRIAFSIPAGAVIDRLGKRRVIIASLILTIPTFLYFIHAKGFFDVLIILSTLSLANAFLLPASSSLVADMTPTDKRGRVMSAVGRGWLMINPDRAVGGGSGMGLVFTIPVIVGSLLGGNIYGLNPTYPWIIQSVFLVASLLHSLAWLHEPSRAEA